MGLFGKKKDKSGGILGVDIGSGGIKIVELQQKNKRAHLVTYGFSGGNLEMNKEPAPGTAPPNKEDLTKQKAKDDAEEIKKLGAVLKELVKRSGAKSKTAVASIPISGVFSAVLTVAKTDEKEQIDAIVQQEARKLLPVPLSEVVLDHSELPSIFADIETQRRNQMKLLMTAAPRKVIARYTAIYKEAGLTLKSLETESFALVRAMVGSDPSAILILDIGASRSNLYLVRGRIPLLHRSINIGGNQFTKVLAEHLGVSNEEAEQMKVDMATKREGETLLEVFKPSVGPIVQEIKYHLQLFEKQLGGASRSEKIILTGGSATLPHLDTYIEDFFQMRTFVGDPWARVVYDDALKMPLDQIGPRFAIPVGLALSEVLPADKMALPEKKK